MMGRMWRAGMVVAAFAMSGLLAACDEDIVGPVGGEVVALVSVDGAALPASIDEGSGTVRRILADTIHLGGNDRWSRRQVQSLDRPDEPVRELDWSSDGTVERFEGQLVLSYVCNDTASCVAPDRLTPVSGGYEITYPRGEGTLVFRYEVVTDG